MLKTMVQAASKPSKAKKKARAAVSETKGYDVTPIVELPKGGVEVFHTVADFLEENGMLEKVDAISLSMFAKQLCLYIEIANAVHTLDDVVQTFDNNSSNVSGAYTALNKAQDQVQKLSDKFGLNPSARARMIGAASAAHAQAQKAQEGDEIDKLM